MAPPNTANSRITAIFYFALTTLITITTATAAAAAAAGPTATGLPVRLTNTDQLVQIGDREPYQAKLTSLAFDKPICIISLNLHTLQPLTGAEDIEITHSLCLATSSNSTWTLTHYTNNKNVFVLRHPILARRLAIVAGFGRADQNVGLTVLNLDIKQCDAQQVFGVGDDVQQEHEIYRHCKSSQNVKVDSKKERVGHRHRHRHLEEGNSTVIRINDLMADHLLPYHPDRAHFEFQQPQKEKLTHLDTTNLRRDDAVFVRHKRQVSTRTTTRKQDPNEPTPPPPTPSSSDLACPSSFSGSGCSVPDCSSLSNCSHSGVCVQPSLCECFPNYSGADCSQCSGWFCNQCDFFCVHGQCDATTKTCVCRPGWAGAACDVCSASSCASEPRVAFLMPPTASWTSSAEQLYTFVRGSDLPQTPDARYHCLFGSVSTTGHWLSSDLIRCPVPRRATPGKHVFNLIPYGSEAYIPNTDAKTVHFTFYVECDPITCAVDCLGPICLCPLGRTGVNCLDQLIVPPKRVVILTNQSITAAVEGAPYAVFVPIPATSLITHLDSNVEGLVVDPFKRQVRWDAPVGSSKDYDVKLSVLDTDVNLEVSWKLRVDPTYSPITGKIEPTLTDNGHVLNGIIQTDKNNTFLDRRKTLPILLEILSSKNPGSILESVEIDSYSKTAFSRVFYPYSDEDGVNTTFTVRSRHPGQLEASTSCATWSNLKLRAVDVEPSESSKMINNTASARFQTNADVLKCRQFDVFVIQPSESLQINGFKLDGDGILEVEFGVTEMATQVILAATIGFSCDTFYGTFVNKNFTTSESANVVRVSPEHLTFHVSSQTSPQFQLVEIELINVEAVNEPLITAEKLLPFYVVSSNPPSLENTGIYRNGSKIKLVLGLFNQEFRGTTERINGTISLGTDDKQIFEIPYSIIPSSNDAMDLIVVVEGLVNMNTTNIIDYPLEISITSLNSLVAIKRIIYVNVRAEFYPLDVGLYRITVKSIMFQNHDLVFDLTPSSNVLRLFLDKKQAIFPVFDGAFVAVKEHNIAEDPTVEAAPEVSMQPSTFYASDLNKDIFVDIVYSRGPRGSVAVLQLDRQDADSSEFLIQTGPISEALCVKCGVRARIKIVRNPLFVQTDKNCNTIDLKVPFVVQIKSVKRDFLKHFDVIVDKRPNSMEPVTVCPQIKNQATPESTTIVSDCATAKLIQCRDLYQPVQGCGAVWRDIPDDTVSIHVYALFLKLKANCQAMQIDLRRLQLLIRCISSLDVDCPLVKSSKNKPSEAVAFNAMFNQLTAISPITKSLHGYFPALSTLEAQLIDFPTHMADFLHYYELNFPTSDLVNIQSDTWFDQFHKIISDQSENASGISPTELENFSNWQIGKSLINRWNQTNYQLIGTETAKKDEDLVVLFQKLVEKADKLKSLARQFGAANPFTMLHDMLATMFSKIDHVENSTDKLAEVVGFVDSSHIYENEEFEVTVVITNVQTNKAMKNLKFQLEMLNDDPPPAFNQSNVNYRIGPLFYTGGIPDYLSPGKTLTVNWKILPVIERRLTETLHQKPNVVLISEVDGKRKVQRIRIPSIKISPNRFLRVFAIATETILPRASDSKEFSLALHLMNAGFSALKNVKITGFNPWLTVHGSDPERVALFRISSVNVDEKFVGYNPDVLIPRLESGKTAFVTFNITTLQNDIASFKNLSLKVLVDNELPEFMDFKFFFIREAIDKTSFVLSADQPSNYQSSLFHFDTKTAKLDDLSSIQLIEKLEFDESTPSSDYHRVLATFQRLMTREELAAAASPERLNATSSVVYGSINMPANLDRNHQLVRVSQISSAGLRRHLLDFKDIWVTDAGSEKLVKFLDQQALPPAISPQLTYEFIYGKFEDFNAPYFSQHYYEMSVPPEMVVQENTVIGRAGAQSPVGQAVNYSLVTVDDVRNFAVNGKTGEIVLVTDHLPEIPQNETGICVNVIATDESKRQTIVPVFIQLPSAVDGGGGEGGERGMKCTIFPKGISINYHVFTGDRSALKMMEFMQFLPHNGQNEASTERVSIADETSTDPASSTEQTTAAASLETTPTMTTSALTTTTTPKTTTESWDEDDLLVNLKTIPTTATWNNFPSAPPPREPFPYPPPFPHHEIEESSYPPPFPHHETDEEDFSWNLGGSNQNSYNTRRPYIITDPPVFTFAPVMTTTAPVSATAPTTTTTRRPPATAKASTRAAIPAATTTPKPVRVTRPRTTPLIGPDVHPTPILTEAPSPATAASKGYTIEAVRITNNFRRTTTTPSYSTNTDPADSVEDLVTADTNYPLQPDTAGQNWGIGSGPTSDSMLESIPSMNRATTPVISPFASPRPTYEVDRGNEDILVNLITVATPPPTAALPVATGMAVYNSNGESRPGTIKIGQIQQNAGVMSYSGQQSISGEQTSASMVDTACRLRETKPIWAVICDMAKTVHFKPMR